MRQNPDNIEQMARGSLASDADNTKAIPFKICLIGNRDTGKTCIVERYVNNKFVEGAPNTLSAAFNSKILSVQPDGFAPTKVKLQIWDTAGAEEFKAINKLYYQKAAIILLVYSISDYESFDSL
jgi:small GTP-binding protein